MRVKAPWLRICLLDDEDDGNYVLPNIDNVVLGGTHQHNDWDTVRIEFEIISNFAQFDFTVVATTSFPHGFFCHNTITKR